LSAAQARYVMEGMARDWTAPRLEALVRAEFEDPDVVDRWVDDPRAPEGRRMRAFPLGPGIGLHVCAGTVPGVSVTSLVRGLLVGSPVLLKPGASDRDLPRHFIDGLTVEAGLDPVARALANSCAAVYWSGGQGGAAEATALANAGYAVVYGHTETARSIRERLPPGTPMVEYGHRISVAVVGPQEASGAPGAVAGAAAAFDQRGCVCPHQVFVVGTAARAIEFSESLAEAMAGFDRIIPPGAPDPGEAAAVQQLRATAELREAAGDGVRVWRGPGVAWTVVHDPDLQLRPSCLSRTIHVTPIAKWEDLAVAFGDDARFLQTVGVVGFDEDQEEQLAELVCGLGASRVVPIDRMSFPPPWWLHDGQGPLVSLVRWGTRGPA
jgi:hypothetical protein